MSAHLISITPDAEKTMGYIARVSNPANQANENVAGLLAYCIRHGHWSVFEHAFMTLEIETTRDIGAQILRHRSFYFQEFSQRYAAVTTTAPIPELRLQDTKNRQNSIEVTDPEDQIAMSNLQMKIAEHYAQGHDLYDELLERGVAKECARKVLPLNTETTIYMTGNVRQWIHYIDLRSGNGTQKEHMEVALAAKEVFIQQLPIVAKALGWTS
jgi:thymidylate synthase (FAD)